ncbi:hypothetical protein [Bacteroidaceae bacterium]|jgi:hypothetical protein
MGKISLKMAKRKSPKKQNRTSSGKWVAADIRWQRDMLVYRFTDAMTSVHQVKSLINNP